MTTDPPLAGRYVLSEQIGAGGMGSVWRAWDLRRGQHVAAKVLGAHDASLLLRFVREQGVRIQHPHVVAPTGWAAEDDRVVLTMDLVRGGSVQALLDAHGPLPEGYVAVLLDQLLQALVAVHDAGVVHRDVKPANLLLEPTGTGRPHLRLADFGIATATDDDRLTRVPGAIGTPAYAAPEQYAGAPAEPGHDLYSVGVVGRVLLGGVPPSRPLRPLLDALTGDPGHRPGSAAAALARLRLIGVPAGAPWTAEPDPPEVVDQVAGHALGAEEPAPVDPARAALRVAVTCLVLAIALSLSAAALLL